jgi:glycosyltransferase involved in cell wall biosynthesis
LQSQIDEFRVEGTIELSRRLRPLRVLLVASHPVQYASPLFRLYAQDPRLEILVAYCSLQGAEAQVDSDFGVEVKWDVPLLEGYPWVVLKSRLWRPRLGSFFGLFNPGIWSLIRRGNFDAVVFLTGYVYATFWMGMAAAKVSGVAVLFGTDAHDLAPRDNKSWRRWVKELTLPRLFRLADVVILPSSGGAALIRSLGIPEERVVMTPYCVDNDWWIAESKRADREAVRRSWGVPTEAPVVLFCAKLQVWKRPHDVLRAFAQADSPNAYLVFCGDGALRSALESEAKTLGIGDRVRFLGFVNQSGLPGTYTASDILVLASEYEPFGVVVNEAMLCGCPVIVSDRVGARFDLVREGETGFVFPMGDIGALSALLREVSHSPERIRRMGYAAREQMASWSPRQNLDALVMALDRAVQLQSRNAGGK